MLFAAALLALAAAAPVIEGVPGVVILDPAVTAQSRIMAQRLTRAGYATLVVRSDPVAAASTLRRRPGVRADDIAIIGYGNGASSVLATVAERYDLDVAERPIFRSAIAVDPNCARGYGDWTGSVPPRASGSSGAPHGGGPAPGLFRNATPLLIVGGRGACRELARYSYAHEYFVDYVSTNSYAATVAFITQNAEYSVVTFSSSQDGTRLIGELTVPDVASPVRVVIISPGTAGIEGFSFWERPWARRLLDLGYASLIVDSYTARHSSWKNHWRIDPRTVKARDLLDARAYLAAQPFARANSIGLLGRSSGGTAVLAAIVGPSQAPFAAAVADYGYCQLAYGAWPGGTPAPSASIAYRTSVPLLIQVGANDTTVSAAACRALVASARDAGEHIDLVVYPNVGHRFDAGVVETPGSTVRASEQRIASFIEAHLPLSP
ncbi:MAG TPA: prolyl oligopeptidase family serine peptidase [Verrucomicrobiae bacterium]|nr:prolyl oligopeptidase family serine peptidase [Verrucomicrobiae bacterium]